MTLIGNGHITSPLGIGVERNFDALLKGESALKSRDQLFEKACPTPVGLITDVVRKANLTKVESLTLSAITASLSKCQQTTGKWLLLLCSTKGDIERLETQDVTGAKLGQILKSIQPYLEIDFEPLIVSTACVSGLMGAITAHDLIESGKYDHALVVGVDVVSEFTFKGFESFMALSDQPCKPFDQDRNGLSLGEAAAATVLSKDENIFNSTPFEFLGGSSSNDANHISGPSRNGEGLTRAIYKTLKRAGILPQQVSAISAHGTATRYNDDMESIAFGRCGLYLTPVNSLKGYYGHTLGVSGLLELIISMKEMETSTFLKSLGCENRGTVTPINVQLTNEEMNIDYLLKTTSGFGGCNATAIIKKL